MKKKLFILLMAACCMTSCNDGIWNAIHGLEEKYNDLDDRVSRLEELCKEMNTNISSLQTLVSVMLNNDYIVSITPIKKESQEIGYTITFAIHSPITIYHGQNGKDGTDGQNGKDGVDGQDGENGKNGATPLIGVALDKSDNAYYWTLDGDWLLDPEGNRIPLTSRDGKSGADGQDGKDGQDGQDGKDGKDGKDGITPQLKIEENYWYVSTDNGTTWRQLGKAVGENSQDGKDGNDGADGQDGQDGDSMFQSVTQDEEFVYFLLSNNTLIVVDKAHNKQKNGWEYIDLGLASGNLWAIHNLGGVNPGDYGDKYTLDALVHDGIDLVHVKMGDGWQLPSSEDWRELINACTKKILTYALDSTGIATEGVRFTSDKNGASIFFPFTTIPDKYGTGGLSVNPDSKSEYYYYGDYNTATGSIRLQIRDTYRGYYSGMTRNFTTTSAGTGSSNIMVRAVYKQVK